MYLHVALRSSLFNLICNMTTFSKKCFNPLKPSKGSGGEGGEMTEYVLAMCSMLHSH